MTAPFHSIRWRLQLWHGLVLLAALSGVCIAVYSLNAFAEFRRIDRELTERDRALIFALSLPKTPAADTRPLSPSEVAKLLQEGKVALPPPTAALFQDEKPGYSYFSFQDQAGHVLLRSKNAPPHLLPLAVPARGVIEETRTVGRRRELCHSSDLGMQSVVGRDISPDIEAMRRFGWSVALAALGVWVAGLFVGWRLAGRALRPIATISQIASRIAEDNLEERIDVAGGASELDQLGHLLNRTFDRLQGALERQRRFTADAAHELRTPITILTSETQRILKRPRTAEEYRKAFESCGETVARMRRLVEDLLLIAKQESVASAHEAYDLAAVVRETIGELSPLAAAKDIRIESDLQPATGYGHPTAISVVANNLLRNAIQHHAGGGTVSLSATSNNGSVVLIVQDDGPGIPSEDLPRIFDRFYRVDKSRANDGSIHPGLGLAIVKAIIGAEGGTVSCESILGKGSSFKVTLPSESDSVDLP